jgi:Holliday junction resolvase RusA-like endonuclease
MPATTFRVAGLPVTQGSKRAFIVAGRPVLVEAAGARHKQWRHAINDAARLAFDGHPPHVGAVVLHADFTLVRPASHPKRKRTWPIGARSGDSDKYLRLVCDALAGVAYLNDAQVVAAHVTKDWADEAGPGVTITIAEVVA